MGCGAGVRGQGIADIFTFISIYFIIILNFKINNLTGISTCSYHLVGNFASTMMRDV